VRVLAAVQNGLEGELAGAGLEVVNVTSEDALDESMGCDPTFVVVDEELPHAVDLVVRLKADVDGPDRDRVPVLSVKRTKGIRCEADLELAGASGAEVADAAKRIIMRRARQRRLFDQAATLEVPSTPEDVDKAGDMLELLIASIGYSPEEEVKLGTTLREAIGNAFEHGNRKDPARTIYIRYLRSTERLAIVVTDEGPGFDTTNFLARADEVSALEHTRSRRDTEARPGGLGVFIMRQTCDDIRFNESGNSIYLMKYLPGPGSSEDEG